VIHDYKEKIEKLPADKLQDLKERYEETISKHEKRLREANLVGMPQVADYQEMEIKKKKEELEIIEAILKSRN
jgi:hypothetical protein